jgi:hypothetical protein
LLAAAWNDGLAIATMGLVVLLACALATRRPRTKTGATLLGAGMSMPFAWVSFLGAHGSGEISDLVFWSIAAPVGLLLNVVIAQILRMALNALGRTRLDRYR